MTRAFTNEDALRRARLREAGMRGTLLLASALVALVVSLALGEAQLRALSPDAYYAWEPNTRVGFHLPPGRAPGIHGPSLFSTNAAGIRGDPFAPQQRYRILAVGGSTTECLLLDDSLAWPHLLQDALNHRVGSDQIWVGNVGRSGHRAVHHELHLKYLLPRYPHIDAVIVLAGINDLQYRLAHDSDYRPDPLEPPDENAGTMQVAFEGLPRRYRSGPPLKRTEIWRRLRTLKVRARAWIGVEDHRQDDGGNNLVTWRRHRQGAGGMRDILPDLGPALEEYRRRLNGVIDEAARVDARVILVTQPSMWRPGLPAPLRDLLWTGGVGDFQTEVNKDYYSVEALAGGLDRYNRVLLAVCRDRGVDCIDLASVVPKDTTAFYDDVHFNEPGARRVAQVVADYLLTHGSLGGLTPTVRAATGSPIRAAQAISGSFAAAPPHSP